MNQMPCSNTQAEIDHDYQQYAYERSREHLEATELLREKKREMVESLLKNNYYTVGKNTYTLRDAIECMKEDKFWDYKPFTNSEISISELINEDDAVEALYISGGLSEFHPAIHSHVVSLVDMVLGD